MDDDDEDDDEDNDNDNDDDDDEDSTPQRCLMDQVAAASGSARKHKSGAMKYWMCWKHFD